MVFSIEIHRSKTTTRQMLKCSTFVLSLSCSGVKTPLDHTYLIDFGFHAANNKIPKFGGKKFPCAANLSLLHYHGCNALKVSQSRKRK